MTEIQSIFQAAADTAVAAGEAGIQIAVYKDGAEVASVCSGIADKASGRRVTNDTLFNAFSCCKAVTNTALHLQAARGLIDYAAKVADYWPEFAAHGKGECTVEDALSHRAGVPQMPDGVTPALMADFDWMTRQIARLEPLFPPGTVNAYHSYTQGWITGELVQRTDPRKRTLRAFIREEIAEPLGMDDAWYGVPESEDHRVATLYGDGIAGLFPPGAPFLKSIPPVVDVSAEVWSHEAMRRNCIPGAGAHFTARSEVRFWAMLAGGGQLDGVRLFTPEQVASFSVPRPDPDVPDAMLGYACNVSTRGFWLRGSEPAVGTSARLLAQTGAGNSIAWADPENGIAVAVCHNQSATRTTHRCSRRCTRLSALCESRTAILPLDAKDRMMGVEQTTPGDDFQIRSVLEAFTDLADNAAEPSEIAELFTPDAVLAMGADSWTGREAIAACLSGMRSQGVGPGSRKVHVLTNVAVSFTGAGRATARSRFMLLDVAAQPAAVVFTGRYLDELRADSGRWAIARRVIAVD